MCHRGMALPVFRLQWGPVLGSGVSVKKLTGSRACVTTSSIQRMPSSFLFLVLPPRSYSADMKRLLRFKDAFLVTTSNAIPQTLLRLQSRPISPGTLSQRCHMERLCPHYPPNILPRHSSTWFEVWTVSITLLSSGRKGGRRSLVRIMHSESIDNFSR